jgi:hypothetical protein
MLAMPLPPNKKLSSPVTLRRALVLFLAAGVAGWMTIAALIYGTAVAWALIAGSSDPVRLQNVTPAVGPAPTGK